MSREQSSKRKGLAAIATSSSRSASHDEGDEQTTPGPLVPPAGGVGVLFCGTMEKRHPYTGQSYPRFLVLTASALHWFKRPRHSELFGEPRGTLWLSWMRRASISGPERRELCLEFDSPMGLGGSSSNGTQQQQQYSSVRPGSSGFSATESVRAGVNSKYERFLGSKRNFIAPTEAAAIAWRAAIELAMRECDDSTKFTVSLSSANPSSLSDYFTQEVTQDMEDGYGDANFLEELGRLVEEDDEYALLPPPGASPQISSPDSRRRILKQDSARSADSSSTKVASVVSYAGRVLARNVAFGPFQSSGEELEVVGSGPLVAERNEEGLVVTLSDGSSASFERDEIWQTTGLLSADLTSPLKHHEASPRRVLTVKVDGHHSTAATLVFSEQSIASFLVVLLLVLFVFLSFAIALIVVSIAIFALLLFFRNFADACRRKACRVEIVDDKAERTSSLRKSSSTSVDDDSTKNIDPKFLAAAKGDRQEASKRYAASMSWRRNFGVDDILDESQPYFSIIKDAYPHWLGGRTRKNELVYWERVGFVDVDKLRDSGVTLDILLRHYIFTNEWTWKVLSPAADGPESCQIVVLDVTGVKLSQVGGLRLEYLRECAKIAQLSYPERTSAYVVINAPAWISIAWRVVEPMLNAEIRKRVHICKVGKQTTDKLLELVHPDHVPTCYGGSFGDPGMTIEETRRCTPEELAFAQYVNNITSSSSDRAATNNSTSSS